ncbi:DUF222 domain-containing protein, partial [Mycobacterium sp. 21AC1]|uniref:HNH endonuclease signature motif containing protein n=1 Tax=[Mycobacterium] appelbergii TaxID=2939269 RepID=UPI0029391EDB
TTKNLIVHIVADPATINAATTPVDATPADKPDPADETATPDQATPVDETAIADEPDPPDEEAGTVDSTGPADETDPAHNTATVDHTSAMDHSHATGTGTTCTVPPAVIVGGGVLTDHQLAELLPQALVRTLHHPGNRPPEPGYVPSRALADFVRCRDMTCRFPGCDTPAYHCDLDHTVPYPHGCTHASNMKCLCRLQRRLCEIHSNYEHHQSSRLPAAIDGPLRRHPGRRSTAQGLPRPV